LMCPHTQYWWCRTNVSESGPCRRVSVKFDEERMLVTLGNIGFFLHACWWWSNAPVLIREVLC